MNRSFACTASIVLLCAAAAAARAESFASSASSAGSASLGSISESFANSSRSSSGDNRTADGDYRVIDVAEMAERPGMVQLTLQPVAPGPGQHEFMLRLPRQALQPHGIASGDVVQVRNRDYGMAFARVAQGQVREPFFLALNDDWHRDLDARAVEP